MLEPKNIFSFFFSPAFVYAKQCVASMAIPDHHQFFLLPPKIVIHFGYHLNTMSFQFINKIAHENNFRHIAFDKNFSNQKYFAKRKPIWNRNTIILNIRLYMLIANQFEYFSR